MIKRILKLSTYIVTAPIFLLVMLLSAVVGVFIYAPIVYIANGTELNDVEFMRPVDYIMEQVDKLFV